MNEDRHLASIMFTDIVGYSSLMSRDESKAMDVLHQNRNIQKTLIESHHGKWLKEIGDGVLAMFPSAYDSVKCAIAIQLKIKKEAKYKVRIGIHLGDITFENDDVFGDGVNIASRIESISNPGGILVSEAIYKTIRSREHFLVSDLGEIALKNIAFPVRIYALTGDGLPAPPLLENNAFKDAKTSKRKRKPIYLSILIVLFLLVVYSLNQLYNQKPALTERKSLAVLPFANLSSNSDYEYLVDGLQDAVIGKLSQIDSLRVISRTSTLRYKDSQHSMPLIAEELKVNHILEASFTGNKEPFIVQVQLLKIFPLEDHIWQDQFEINLDDVLNLPSLVADRVSNALNLRLTYSESSKKVSPEVYELYTRGMYSLDKGTPDDMKEGMKFLTEAVDLDPTASFAYAGLAEGFVILGHSPQSVPEHFVKAKAAAKQALALEKNNAHAYAALADVYMYFDWEWENAETAFQHAIKLNPNLAEAHAHYTWLHVIYGRWDEAIAEARLTVDLDPFSTIYTSWLAWLYWWAGHNEEAIEWANKTLEMNPNFSVGYMVLGSALTETGDYNEALIALKKAAELNRRWNGQLAYLLVTMGNQDEAMELLEAMENNPESDLLMLCWMYAALGINDKAINNLYELKDNRNRIIPWIHAAPGLKSLYNEERFHRLLQELELPAFYPVEKGINSQARLILN